MEERKILIVDDEKSIVEILKFNLEKEGYKTYEAYDADEAIEKAFEVNPDLILLDVMLPKSDGFTVCRRIRQKLSCPIIMLTAREDVVDKIIGLELGADDYMTKPFSIREVIARIKANLRKYVKTVENKVDDEKQNGFMIKDMFIDSKNYLATINGKIIDLTTKEFDLLKLLSSSPNEVFTREQILKTIWGYDYYGDARTVDVTVRRLREKIENNTAAPKYLLTKRGMGYYVTLK
ncbi:MAG: two component transcriptional regulator, winged helix family [Clostridia bacterium]|jgi:two-component system response regulator VicR|nr:two component transcriptional regulator, winged helix family [Clostridia bacterium]